MDDIIRKWHSHCGVVCLFVIFVTCSKVGPLPYRLAFGIPLTFVANLYKWMIFVTYLYSWMTFVANFYSSLAFQCNLSDGQLVW